MTCLHGENIVICTGPTMEEHTRTYWGEHWCFKCRKRRGHDAVLMVPTTQSYYGPHWKVECHGCREDHVRFPGTEDGPTLVMADA